MGRFGGGDRSRVALFVIALVAVLCLGSVRGDAGADEISSGGGSGPLMKEIERLRQHVEKKDAHISVMEKELARGGGGASKKLESELESLSVKVKQLEEELASATKQSEQAHRYAEALKKRAEIAEESVRDLESKYEKSQSSLSESKIYGKDIERQLKASEATVTEAEKRLEVHGEELSRVRSQWLPHWASTHAAVLQTRARAKWTSHAKPHVDKAYKYTSERAAAAHAAVKPHLEKVGPAARKQWKTVSDSVAPHVELVRSKTLAGYEVVRKDYVGKAHEFVQPHLNTVMETGRPYVVLVQERTRPYVDQVSSFSKPYLESAKNFANPHLEKVPVYYQNAVSAGKKQHEYVQEVVRKQLARHNSLASIATRELVWFLSTFIFAIPIVALLLIFGSATKKAPPSKRLSSTASSNNSSSTHGHSKHKRARKADK